MLVVPGLYFEFLGLTEVLLSARHNLCPRETSNLVGESKHTQNKTSCKERNSNIYSLSKIYQGPMSLAIYQQNKGALKSDPSCLRFTWGVKIQKPHSQERWETTRQDLQHEVVENWDFFLNWCSISRLGSWEKSWKQEKDFQRQLLVCGKVHPSFRQRGWAVLPLKQKSKGRGLRWVNPGRCSWRKKCIGCWLIPGGIEKNWRGTAGLLEGPFCATALFLPKGVFSFLPTFCGTFQPRVSMWFNCWTLQCPGEVIWYHYP